MAGMFTARKKIQKENGAEPDELEDSVAQAMFDLEVRLAPNRRPPPPPLASLSPLRPRFGFSTESFGSTQQFGTCPDRQRVCVRI